MPFVNQSIDKSSVSPQIKGNKLNIILIALIILSGGYLAYSFYTENESNSNKNTGTLEEVNVDINSNESDNGIAASSIPQDTELLGSNIDNSNNQIYTLTQVAENNNKSSCWTIVEGNVYNITSYIPNHPGGESKILQACGKDGTSLFNNPSEHRSNEAGLILRTFKIGEISP